MIEDDLRFPNRKKKVEEPQGFAFDVKDSEPESLFGEPITAEPQSSSSEKSDIELPRGSGYRIIEPVEESPQKKVAPTDLFTLCAASAEADAKRAASAAPIFPTPAPVRDLTPQLSSRELWMERIRIFCESPARVYTAAGVGLGILLGVVIALVFWLTAEPEGRYDLGPATSGAAGLTGRLHLQWEKKLQYRLTLGPSDAEQKAGFALAVDHSPRPLSVQIHLQDNQGFVLCSKDILLKYDSKNAAALGESAAEAQPGNAEIAASGSPAPAQLDAQEAAREQGKDIFQNQVGADGEISSLEAQGEIPCSAKAYENTSSWSFVPDFPSLAEQDELLKLQEKARDNAKRLSLPAAPVHKNTAAKAAGKYFTYAIEGDDSIVEFDASRGVIETTGRKIFFFDKNSGNIGDPRWEDYPISIHYRCDQNSECVLTHTGLGVLRARLRR
jgi:hypothetical protein